MAGIKEIARQAGVSPSTVSNALNGKKNVGAETRARILQIAEELDYLRPDDRGTGAGMRSGRTILFNFSDFDTLFYLDILHGISDFAYHKGYDILVSSEKNIERYARAEFSSGCIVADYRCDDSQLRKIADQGCPVIVLDRLIAHAGIKSILVSNYASEKQLMEELIAAGYERFAFLGGLDTADNRERYHAFRDALEEHHLPFRRSHYYEGDWREKSGAQAARILLLSEEMPEVLVCANDMMAIGAIRKFQEEGLRVPDDIAVCGFDDIIISKYMGLTTVSVPDYERGYLSAQALFELIEGRGSCEPFYIGARVKWRSSTKQKGRRTRGT